MATATATLKILGITDEKLECECCGKTNLKCTVALELEEGGVVYYGRDCAAKALMGNNKPASVKTVESLANAIEYARKWLGATPAHTALVVANAIRVRFCGCSAVGNTIVFNNDVVVAK